MTRGKGCQEGVPGRSVRGQAGGFRSPSPTLNGARHGVEPSGPVPGRERLLAAGGLRSSLSGDDCGAEESAMPRCSVLLSLCTLSSVMATRHSAELTSSAGPLQRCPDHLLVQHHL